MRARDQHAEWMLLALTEAHAALVFDDVPVGAIVVDAAGAVIGRVMAALETSPGAAPRARGSTSSTPRTPAACWSSSSSRTPMQRTDTALTPTDTH